MCLEQFLCPIGILTDYLLIFLSGVPYEITTFTTDMSGAGTDADVYVVLYGRDTCTEQKSLCPVKQNRKKLFERGQKDKFVLEVRALSTF